MTWPPALVNRVLGPFRSWWKEERRTLPSLKVRRQVCALVALGLLTLSALEVRRRAVLLEQREQERHREAMAIVVASLASIRRTAYDWGHWDDMYAFVRGDNPSFLRTDVATTSLFDDGGVLVLLDPLTRPLLLYSRGGEGRTTDRPLADCTAATLRALDGRVQSGLRLLCRNGEGQWMLGVFTRVSNSANDAPSHGSLVMFEPLERKEYGSQINRRLSQLGRALVPVATRDSQPITPTLFGPGGQELALVRTATQEQLIRSLASDLLKLLALGLLVLGLRMMLLLERRRQILERRRIERRANQRIRRTGRELERLLARTGMDPASSEADQRLLARLLEPDATPQGDGGGRGGLEHQLELLTRRFQDFLRGARSLALFDPLTKLPNRRYFVEQLALQAETPGAKGRRFAILFIDVDRFKSINDTYGHAIGDSLLVVVADRLRTGMRNGDFLARYGGDEFAMLVALERSDPFDHNDARAAAYSLASRIANAFQVPVHLPGVELELSISIGIDLESLEAGSAEETMKRCDIAMSRAKQHKHSRIAIFDVAEAATPLDDYRLYVDLIQAVRDHAIDIVFQPIVNADRSILGLEALARWHHPKLGPISPELFLDLAERHRQMLLVGNELLEVSIKRYSELIQRFRKRGLGDQTVRLCLNLAPSMLSDSGLVERLRGFLVDYGIEAGCITIELTERSVIEPNNVVLSNLHDMRGLGMRLSLDDFGTGYSSLHLLSSLDPDEVKIDKSFVMAMRNDELARQIVVMVARMAPTIGIEIVAEGVDDPKTVVQLENLGIHCFQGFLFSRPLVVADLLDRCTVGGGGLILHPPRSGAPVADDDRPVASAP